MPFINDLILGKHFEQVYLKITRQKGVQRKFISAPDRKFFNFDLIIITEGERVAYEVKADRLTNSTGNIVIEYECNKRPSGINTTQADYYIYFVIVPVGKVGEEYIYDYVKYYKIPTEVIRDSIEREEYRDEVSGGDRFSAKMYRFKEELFAEFCVANPVEPVELNEEPVCLC